MRYLFLAETRDISATIPSLFRNISWLLPPLILSILVLPFVQWGFSDDDVFIQHYLVGQPYPFPMGSDGRFFPLGHQEWRLLPRMTQAWMFHGTALIEYSIFCFAVWTLIAKRPNIKGLSAFIFVVTLPPIVISFSNIILPERNQLTAVALWFLFYNIWKNTRKISFGLLALFFANLGLYYKEPTCLFLGGFALVQLVLSLKSHGTHKLFRECWSDIALLASCAIFLLVYFSIESVRTITGPAAYAGNYLSLTKGLPTFGRLALKDPLVVLLMLWGAGLNIHHLILYKSERRPYLALWVGAVLYFCSLMFAGLSSKYYDALPIFGFGLLIAGELVRRTMSNLARMVCWAIVFVNTILWAPSIAYKYDWTERNVELVDHILEHLGSSNQTDILITKGDHWDAAMFILYAKAIRGINAQFYCDGAILSHGSAPCRLHEVQRDIGIRINLGYVMGERTGTLQLGSKELWRYRGIWERLIPTTLRSVLKPQYNIW